ncbi:molybdenum cofactor biosynthesis protein B [Salinarchaeum sp. Harcht-Bsk1]|uniref:MogA/MoaB family molybdenum cofactor biosynthesis protein n=1 Tax=Salinarchaeum sp. Harcht-Bsk1 TaxID=1333523 RepID=UPI00034228B0|nr:MogA/MoaB family molybdenum cofactor biosynthesis protein [Salinarchaeum sp. Harcht-Bsk1]AGN01681.1 molybdenum cofactor biosynthesis protein B [Salinarchaeum sp. Harcht-Bsk1]
MVDFQSRDTRRSLGGDESEDRDDADDPDETTGEDPSSDGSSETGDDDPAEDEHDHGSEHADHDHHADDLETVSAAVLTVSTSRSIDDDASGDAIVEVLEGEGHEIATRELVNDDYDGVQSAVSALVNRKDVDAVVTTGGTGVAPADVTPEAVRPLFEKELPGFGELFRAKSREEIGTRVVGTRALAGIADGVPVFCLPGSESAARTGTAEVVEPEVGHLAGLSRPHDIEEE